MNDSNIKQKTKIGMIWNSLEKITVQIISFVLNIVLARLLSPHDYGTIGLLYIFFTFSNVFIESGFSKALIQKQNKMEIDFSTVLIFNVAISCLIYLVLFICSPAIATFYKIPELVTLQRVFFLIIIINSLSIVQNTKLQIKIDFKSIALINSITTIVSGILGIISAYFGLGVWALVIQNLSKSLISTALFWIFGHWIPKTGFSFSSFKQLFSYGSKLLISAFLGTSINCVNNVVIGKYYNPESLGHFTRAQQFPDITSGTINSIISGVTFPLLSELQQKTDDLINTTKKLLRITAMIVFPSMIGLAVLSKPIILVLLGEKWMDSSVLLFWLALSSIFLPLSTINLNVLNAIGRSDLFLKVDLLKIPIIVLTMVITFPISLKAVVVGKAITAFIYFYMNAFLIGKLYKFGAFKQLLCLWKYIVSAIIMGIAVYLITLLFSSMNYKLFIGLFSGILIYAILLFLLQDSEFKNLYTKILNKLSRKSKEC